MQKKKTNKKKKTSKNKQAKKMISDIAWQKGVFQNKYLSYNEIEYIKLEIKQECILKRLFSLNFNIKIIHRIA